MLRWQVHPVAKIPNGYGVAVADVNGDGKADILALSSVESIVEWYENPTWKPHVITTRTKGNISLVPLRFKGSSSLNLALATDFSLEDSRHGGNLWWAEPGPSPESEWSLRSIGQLPSIHRLRWADLDGDGRPELVGAPLLGFGAEAPEYKVGARLTWYEVPGPVLHGQSPGPRQEQPVWAPHLIDDSLTVIHGIEVFDWDGDGRDEVLTASFEGVYLFDASGRGKDLRWTKIRLAAGDQISKLRRGASEIAVGNVHGRRFIVTVEPWHGEQVAIYFEAKRGGLWSRHVIDNSFRDGHALACADLNADGDDEIVAGFRGPGTSLCVYYAADSTGANWERQVLDEEMAASAVVIADLNGDGRPDAVAIGASTGNVKWYENLG